MFIPRVTLTNHLRLTIDLIFQYTPGLWPDSFIDPQRAYARSDWSKHSRLMLREYYFDHLELVLEMICHGNPGLCPDRFICVTLSLCSSWFVKVFQAYPRREFLRPTWAYVADDPSQFSKLTSGELYLDFPKLMLEMTQQRSQRFCLQRLIASCSAHAPDGAPKLSRFMSEEVHADHVQAMLDMIHRSFVSLCSDSLVCVTLSFCLSRSITVF